MNTQQLPQAEWGTFLDELSRQNESSLVSVTVSGNGMTDAPVLTDLPLLGVQLNTKGNDAGSITIIAGQSAADAISHTVPGVTQVSVARDADGTVAAIQVDAPDPAQTQVHFHAKN